MSGGLLVFLVVFTPWAFGTTQGWSEAVANGAAIALGALLLAKGWIRWRTGYRHGGEGRPDRPAERQGALPGSERPPGRGSAGRDLGLRVLGVLTVLLVGYVLVGAFNARADYDPARRGFDYFREPLRWLPFSYDRGASWAAALRYVGFASVFWAICDWGRPRGGEAPSGMLCRRLRVLLWVLCVSGAALAIVGVLQRADGTNKLLWVVESRSNKSADAVFGPWSYRANAAQYLNLMWPVCLAFWLWLQNRVLRQDGMGGGRFDGPELVLLPCALAMAAGPILSGSRGGALIAVGLAGACMVLLVLAPRGALDPRIRRLAGGVLLVAALGALIAGWGLVGSRLRQVDARFHPGLTIGTNEFTLLVRARLSALPRGVWSELATVPGTAGRGYPFQHAVLQVNPEGRLFGRLYGSRTNDRFFVEAPLVDPLASDRESTVALIRREGLRIAVDGTELPVKEYRSGRRPGWDAAVATPSLTVGPRGVTEVALVGAALTPAELQAAARASLMTLSALLEGINPAPVPVSLTPTEVVPAIGAEAETVTRRTDTTIPWLSVRRREDAGYLGFRCVLEGRLPVLRGQPRVACVVWNPTDLPLHVGVSLDGSEPERVEVPPQSEHPVRVTPKSPRGSAPGSVEVTVCDEEGLPVDDLPAGARLLVRDLRVDAEVAMFARTVRPGFSFRWADLADRMSGRPVIYENARRMAADYPVWGAGAGTFGSLYQLYRGPGQVWAAYAHDDWLETRITLGWVGWSGVVAALGVLFALSWRRRRDGVARLVVAFWWLALGGCLVHAKFDFPFQIHSVALLFVVLAALLVALTRGPAEGEEA